MTSCQQRRPYVHQGHGHDQRRLHLIFDLLEWLPDDDVATVIDFVTALGVDGLEAWLVNANTTATILPEKYETEQQNMIAFMPR